MCFQALDSVSEDKRDDLHGDLELWVEEIVRHSMTVAHMCQDGHRDLIIKTCQRVCGQYYHCKLSIRGTLFKFVE